MTFYRTTRDVELALIEWLYDKCHGWYMVSELTNGKWVERHVLNRQQAVAWRNPDPKRYSLVYKHIRP